MIETSNTSAFDNIKWALWLVVGIYLGVVLFSSHLNHDVAWIIYSSREMMKGAQFGRDVIDVNPPLIWWFTMPSVFAAQVTGLSVAMSFRIFILLLIALSILLLKRSDESIAGWQMAAIAAALVLMPGYDFGQREHIMLILVLPYLATALQSQRTLPRWLKISTGLLAGIGICLKPYFLLIPIGVELARWFTTGNFRALFRLQTFSMGLIGVIYIPAALLLAPQYFSHVLPVAMTSYSVYNNPPIAVLSAMLVKSTQALLALAAAFNAKAEWNTAIAFLVAAAAAALAVMAQSKGWNYHILPVPFFLVVAVVLVAGRVKNLFVYRIALIFAGLAVFIPAAIHSWDKMSATGEQAVVSALAERMKNVKSGRKVYAFTMSPRIVWPAMVAADARWADTTCCAYLLPAAINQPQNTKAVRNAEQFLARLLKKLKVEQPQMIFFDTRKNLLAVKKAGFDFESYLASHKGWSQFLAKYKPAPPVAHYAVIVLD